MMKHTRKTLRRFAASFLAVMLLAALAIVPASAESSPLDVNETGNTITFTKVVDMTDAEGAGNPSGNFVFTVTDDTGNADAQIVDEDNATDGVQIVAPLTTGTSVDVDIAFNMTAFTAPGVYTYTLQETSSSIDGMVIDDTTYTLSVVVVNANATDPDGTTYKIDSAEIKTADGGKTDTITNYYHTYDLTLDKVVTGAFGNHNEDFTFTVVFTTNDDNATSFQWAYASETPVWNTETFTAGTATVRSTLSDGESIMFRGLPQGTTYTITEGENDYTTTAAGSGVNENTGKVVSGDFVVDGTHSDVAVTYTNTMGATPATGIITTFAPYALMVVVAAGACFFFLRRRNAAED